MAGLRGLDDYRLGRLPSRMRAFQALVLFLCTTYTAIGAEPARPEQDHEPYRDDRKAGQDKETFHARGTPV